MTDEGSRSVGKENERRKEEVRDPISRSMEGLQCHGEDEDEDAALRSLWANAAPDTPIRETRDGLDRARVATWSVQPR